MTTDLVLFNSLSDVITDRMLSTEAITSVLSLASSASIRCFEPISTSHAPPKGGFTLQSESKIIVPFHDKYHWTVLILETDTGVMKYLDSLATTSGPLCGNIEEAISAFTKRLKEKNSRLVNTNFEIQKPSCCKQNDSINCGIHVIANSLSCATGMDLPESFDYQAWRAVISAIMRVGCNDDLPRYEVQAVSSPELIRKRLSAVNYFIALANALDSISKKDRML